MDLIAMIRIQLRRRDQFLIHFEFSVSKHSAINNFIC